MSRPRLRRLLLITLSAATAIALTACGDGAASGGGDGAAATTIRIAYQAFRRRPDRQEQGLAGAGTARLHHQWTKFDSGASINTAFVAKSVDIAASGRARWHAACRRR